MKRILSLALSLILALAFVGCGVKKENSSENSEASAVQNANAEAEANSSESNSESSAESTTSGSDINNDIPKGEVELCDYKNISLDWESTTNSQLLDNALSSYTASTKEVTDRAVENGDIVNIDYAGYKNGVAFDGGTAEGADLEIGSGTFIQGFEAGLVGAKPGESVNLDLTFPETYHNADLAGQDVVFKVTVNYIKEETYADEDMLSAKKSVFGQALLNHILINSQFGPLNEELTSYYTPKYEEMFESQIINYYGYESVDAYIKASGSTKESYQQMITQNVEYRVRYDTLVNALAEKENASISDKEYTDGLKQYAEASGQTEKTFEEANGKELIKSELLAEKVMAIIEKYSEIK